MSERQQGDRDGFASGTRGDDAGREDDVSRPGVTGGGANYLPESEDRAGENRGSDAAAAEGTIGAVGEMDFTGAPAGTSGAGGASGASPAGESRGGGTTGAGSQTTGGTGPASAQGDPGGG